MREQFANNAADTLDGGIDDSVTSLDVSDASEFPATGNFRILIDSEILLVTGVESNTFTVERAQEGTSAASHASGAVVTHLLTTESLKRLTLDNVALADIADRPVLGRITDASGDVIDSTDFVWLNQGEATVTDHDGCIRMYHPPGTSTLNLRGLYVDAPASAPWQVTAALHAAVVGTNPVVGIFIRESATEKLLWHTRYRGNLLIERFDDPATFIPPSRLNTPARLDPVVWLRIRVEESTIRCYVSESGADWIEVYSEGLTDHFTTGPDQAGIVFNASSEISAQFSLTVFHFSFS